MKHPILVLICTLALSANLNAQKIPTLKPLKELPGALFPFEKKGEWGYVDEKGKTVIKAMFEAAEEFHPVTSDGVTMEVAKIRVEGKWGFITKEKVYLFLPTYDELTDFDDQGNAVGTAAGIKSLLGVHPALNERKTFETLAGSVLKLNLNDLGPFNEFGVALASNQSKWGLLNRKGSWVLPADYDSIGQENGMYIIHREEGTGIADLDGSILVEPVYEDLAWNSEKNLFTAVKDGRFGILYKNGKVRYPCIFDQVPVESERGYVEMWQGDTPALFLPDDRLYTVDEYDEILLRDNPSSYATNPILPDWMKKHLEKVGLVRVVSDLRKKDEVDVSAYEDNCSDYSVFTNTILKCGRPLSEVLTEFMREPFPSEVLTIIDDGDMLYVCSHSIEDYHNVSVIDLKGEGRSWWESACGSYTVLKKEKILADDGVWAGGFSYALSPKCFNKIGKPHIPVLRYEYHTWGGRSLVFLGHNVSPEEANTLLPEDSWRRPILGPTAFLLGDFLHSDSEDYRENSYVQILPAGTDGISVYEIQQQGISLSDDGDHLSRGSKKTVAYGFIGLTRPFFTEPLFEEAGSVEKEMAEVTIDGVQKRMTLRQLQSLDPFMQPDTEDKFVPQEPEKQSVPIQKGPAPAPQKESAPVAQKEPAPAAQPQSNWIEGDWQGTSVDRLALINGDGKAESPVYLKVTSDYYQLSFTGPIDQHVKKVPYSISKAKKDNDVIYRLLETEGTPDEDMAPYYIEGEQTLYMPNGAINDDIVFEKVYPNPVPFQLVEVKPSFNGGDTNEFALWIKTNMVYPEVAKKERIQGRTLLNFIITPEGELTDVSVLRSSGDVRLDDEAVRVVSSSPKWEPGKQFGQAVPVSYSFPVYFQLSE